MAYMDWMPKKSAAHDHALPEPNEDFCSCCRKAIVHGYENVMAIKAMKETVLDFEGNAQGTRGHEYIKAYYHAKCWQENHQGGEKKRVIECKYCGVFAMAKTLKDGSPNPCQCACHNKGEFCSLLIL